MVALRFHRITLGIASKTHYSIVVRIARFSMQCTIIELYILQELYNIGLFLLCKKILFFVGVFS